jgi:hypothetical protein
MSAPDPSSHPSGCAAADDRPQPAAGDRAYVTQVYGRPIGRKDHYAADRTARRRLATAVGVRQAVWDNRAFLGRVTRYLAAGAGTTQLIDIRSGLPARPSSRDRPRSAAWRPRRLRR